MSGLRVRRSIQDIQADYEKGKKKPLEDLMRAWKGIKELPPTDPNSFFMIGGYHGEPFRGGGWGSSSYWGGYCNHGNVLFPTWHRAYLLRLEDALRSIPRCGSVTLPFWDETSEDSQKGGIPWALTRQNFELDGKTIPNPLRSFVFTHQIKDFINADNPNYSKPQGYETVRYPLSGLVGSAADRQATERHNALYPDYATNVELLNKNIVAWLTAAVVVNGKPLPGPNILTKYLTCLDAPNYTVFSNTTSAAQWNIDTAALDINNQPVEGHNPPVVIPLEAPHNSMHLAVGGFDVPGQGDFSAISGANGDMGENDTAGLDPIFFFHHCFVDRVFWLWQRRHGHTKALDLIEGYPGTNTIDSQGPTPGFAPNSWLTLDSPLDPFKKKDGTPYTSRDCVNIEKLGYTYGPGSLDDQAKASAVRAAPPAGTKRVIVTGINRAAIRGSFLVSAYATIDGRRQLVGLEAVLSRWSVAGCANCQAHLELKTHMPLPALPAGTRGATADAPHIEVEVRTRDGVLSSPRAALLPMAQKSLFHVEVR